GTVSLESVNFPGYFLRHRNHEAWVEQRDGSTLFAADASFVRRSGLAGSGTASLESVNFPGYFLRHRAGQVWVEQDDATAAFRAGASFVLE
ncbi:AbfB domain-containing protein, partial [Nonomuraea sp. NPDC004297]